MAALLVLLLWLGLDSWVFLKEYVPRCAKARERRLRARTKLTALWAMSSHRAVGVVGCAGGVQVAGASALLQRQPQQNPKAQTQMHTLVRSQGKPGSPKTTSGPPEEAKPNSWFSETTTRSIQHPTCRREHPKRIGCPS